MKVILMLASLLPLLQGCQGLPESGNDFTKGPRKEQMAVGSIDWQVSHGVHGAGEDAL